MPIYYKENGVWVETKRPFVKAKGVYTAAQSVWVKTNDTWELSYTHDTTPPDPPEISLTNIENRYIKVGIRLPGIPDPDLKRVRLLVSRTEMPSSQYGSGYLSGVDDSWPNEPWSDWYFNASNPTYGSKGDHGINTSDFDYKQYPLNPTKETNLPNDKRYYFAAWSEDFEGNWSAGTMTSIFLPKSNQDVPDFMLKETNFAAKQSGTAGVNKANYVEGVLTQQETPRKNGFWFYGSKITSAIGEQGTPTIQKARIRITRTNDSGQPTANVYLFWHRANNPTEALLDADHENTTLLGTINKGESKWFDLPTSHLSHLDSDIKGFGLSYGIQAQDYLVAAGLDTDVRSGQLNVVWREAL